MPAYPHSDAFPDVIEPELLSPAPSRPQPTALQLAIPLADAIALAARLLVLCVLVVAAKPGCLAAQTGRKAKRGGKRVDLVPEPCGTILPKRRRARKKLADTLRPIPGRMSFEKQMARAFPDVAPFDARESKPRRARN